MKRGGLLLLILTLVAGACGGGDGPVAGGSTDGEFLFSQPVLGRRGGCSPCHSLEPGHRLVGPSLAGVATRAAAAIEGMSAADYLHQSIVDPDAYVVEGFIAGRMKDGWDEILSPEQVDGLVEYMLTLKES